MPLHMLKIAAGVSDLAELKELQKERKKERGVYAFYTRNMPKRQEEILDGGSVYWVVKGQVQARQKIKGFRPIVNRRGRRFSNEAVSYMDFSKSHRTYDAQTQEYPNETWSGAPTWAIFGKAENGKVSGKVFEPIGELVAYGGRG